MKTLQRRLVRVAAAAVAVLGWGIGVANASLVNPGFESGDNLFGTLPQVFGIWGADISSILTAENGVTPRTGDQMLRFDCAFLGGCPSGVVGDVWQLVDIGAFPAGTLVETTSYFNRAPGAPPEFGGEIRVWPSLPVNYDGPVDFAIDTFLTDADPATWEVFHLSLVLPAGVNVLGVLVQQWVIDDTLGGYADDISIAIVPLPAALPLFLSALAGLGLMGWRRRQAGA